MYCYLCSNYIWFDGWSPVSPSKAAVTVLVFSPGLFFQLKDNSDALNWAKVSSWLSIQRNITRTVDTELMCWYHRKALLKRTAVNEYLLVSFHKVFLCKVNCAGSKVFASLIGSVAEIVALLMGVSWHSWAKVSSLLSIQRNLSRTVGTELMCWYHRKALLKLTAVNE
jgi:hypothetical protein